MSKRNLELLDSGLHIFQSEEFRQKSSTRASKTFKDTNWYNDGIRNKMSKIHPGIGWTLGRISLGKWWSTGEIEVRSHTCPGENYLNMRLKK